MTDLEKNLHLYLMTHGWRRLAARGPSGWLWSHPEARVSVAVPLGVERGSLDWRSIMDRLASVGDTEVADVEFGIELTSADVANLRASHDLIIRDTIPYPAAVVLVQSAWTMLRASATTSMRVRSHIGRSYSRRADQIAKQARMAHTRRGSFIVPIVLPLSHPPAIDPGLVDASPAEPMERRVMRTFAEALVAVRTTVVKKGQAPDAQEVMELVRAGVSVEFATALHRVLIQESVAEFSAAFEWAPLGGPAPDSPSTVVVPAAAAPLVAETVIRLQSARHETPVETLTGPIHSISREAAAGGVVTIDTFRNSRSAHVSVLVTTDELLDDALDWMKRRTTVVIEGGITREGTDLVAQGANTIYPLAARELPFGD